jgi:hypothetical protein
LDELTRHPNWVFEVKVVPNAVEHDAPSRQQPAQLPTFAWRYDSVLGCQKDEGRKGYRGKRFVFSHRSRPPDIVGFVVKTQTPKVAKQHCETLRVQGTCKTRCDKTRIKIAVGQSPKQFAVDCDSRGSSEQNQCSDAS